MMLIHQNGLLNLIKSLGGHKTNGNFENKCL